MKYALLQGSVLPSPPPSKEKLLHAKNSSQHILNTIFPPRYVLSSDPMRWCCPTYSTNTVLGAGQREMTNGCNKCPVQLQQEKMLFSQENCWTKSYSKDMQEQQESAPYAGNFITSALVRWQQWINTFVVRKVNQGYRNNTYCYYMTPAFFLIQMS